MFTHFLSWTEDNFNALCSNANALYLTQLDLLNKNNMMNNIPKFKLHFKKFCSNIDAIFIHIWNTLAQIKLYQTHYVSLLIFNLHNQFIPDINHVHFNFSFEQFEQYTKYKKDYDLLLVSLNKIPDEVNYKLVQNFKSGIICLNEKTHNMLAHFEVVKPPFRLYHKYIICNFQRLNKIKAYKFSHLVAITLKYTQFSCVFDTNTNIILFQFNSKATFFNIREFIVIIPFMLNFIITINIHTHEINKVDVDSTYISSYYFLFQDTLFFYSFRDFYTIQIINGNIQLQTFTIQEFNIPTQRLPFNIGSQIITFNKYNLTVYNLYLRQYVHIALDFLFASQMFNSLKI